MSLFEKIAYEINGLTQHVQHNGQLADPSNPFSVAMKKLTTKPAKQKTEKDFKDLEDLEWEGSLYLDAARRVIVPGTVIEGALANAAKKMRSAPTIRSGVCSQGDWPLIYDGPKAIEKLKADPNFRLRVGVVNPSTRSRVMRTRPIFRTWSLKFELLFRPDIVDRKTIDEVVKILGANVGLSDDRSKMGGRFEVVSAA
jgi:hypothetical protein